MFKDKNTRISYFLLGCIPLRLFIFFLAKYIDKKYLKYFSIILFIQGISFLLLYFLNKRLTAPEAGGKTWWAKYRLIHGGLYLISSIYAFQGKDITWVPLLIDVLFGLIIFILHHN